MSDSNDSVNSSGDQQSSVEKLRHLQANLPDTKDRAGYRMPDTQDFSEAKGLSSDVVEFTDND